MKRQGNDSDRGFLADKFAQKESAPNPELWKNLESQLTEVNSKRRRAGFYWWSIASVVVIGAVFGGWFVMNQPETETQNYVERGLNKVVESNEASSIDREEEKENFKKKQREMVDADVGPVGMSKGKDPEPLETRETNGAVTRTEKVAVITTEKENVVFAGSETRETPEFSRMSTVPIPSLGIGSDRFVEGMPIDYRPEKEQKWKVSLSTAIRGFSKRNSGGYVYVYLSEDDAGQTSSSNEPMATSIFAAPDLKPGYSACIEIERTLGTRLSLTSGLWFSRMSGSSEHSELSGEYSTEMSFSRNVYGIPLTMSYKILDRNKFSVSLDVGALAEYSGKIKTNYHLMDNGDPVESTNEATKDPVLQLHGNVFTSLDYKLNGRWVLSLDMGGQLNDVDMRDKTNYFSTSYINPVVRLGCGIQF